MLSSVTFSVCPTLALSRSQNQVSNVGSGFTSEVLALNNLIWRK